MSREPREWLTKLRNDKQWSQERLAEASAISRNYLSEIESGAKNPSVDVAQRIASAMDFNWTLFFALDSRETRQKQPTV